MNRRFRTSLQSMKASLKQEKEKVEMQGSKVTDARKPTTSRRASNREIKMALQQDVDKLKKKLRHEENVHRALERAFNRPLGALPRLPPYLPPSMKQLLAEVAILEEEVARLEEQVVHFRQYLYQEAVYTSSSKKNTESSVDLCDPCVANANPKQEGSTTWAIRQSASLSADGRRKENQLCTNSMKKKKKGSSIPVKRPSSVCKPAEKHLDPQKLQLECRVRNPENAEARNISVSDEGKYRDDGPNRISEDIGRCLSSILLRMSSGKRKGTAENLHLLSTLAFEESSEETEFQDPYGICSQFGKRDIGPYKHLFAIEAYSMM